MKVFKLGDEGPGENSSGSSPPKKKTHNQEGLNALTDCINDTDGEILNQ